MTWHSMADLGYATLTRGYELKAAKVGDACGEINLSTQLACIQVSMLRQLSYIRREMASCNSDLYAMRLATKNLEKHFIPAKKLPPKKAAKVLISSLDLSKLRVRARKVVRRVMDAKVAKYTSDLSESFLLRHKQCGVVSAKEILKWAGVK